MFDVNQTGVSHVMITSTVKRTFDEGAEYCRNVIKGELALTEDEDTTRAMETAVKSVPDWKVRCFYKFYTGYVRHKTEDSFGNPNNKERVTDLAWADGEPDEMEEERFCPDYDMRLGAVINTGCSLPKCTVCSVAARSSYQLRGVCNDLTWLVDINFVLSEKRTFLGINCHQKRRSLR